MQTIKNLEDINEEFNNFMHKVNEISGIVKKLSSDDKQLQQIGTLEADQYLKEKPINEDIDDENIKLRIKNDKSVINWNALKRNEDPSTMSQEAFMAEVSRDADRRYKDRKIRTEKCETFKKQASLAFKRGEYEKALCCYNKALDQVRDNPQIYLDRCVTELKLDLYEPAIEDAQKALRLKEDSLRAHLLLAKAYYKIGKYEDFEKTVEEAKEHNRKKRNVIEEFVRSLTSQTGEDICESKE